MINLIDMTHRAKAYEPLLKAVIDHAYEKTATNNELMLSVVVVDDATMQTMNKQYRDKDRVTDVLTFPSTIDDELGDVVIALDTAMRQAETYGHSVEREMAFLAVHGFLHALGYDHDNDENAQAMKQLQADILESYGLSR